MFDLKSATDSAYKPDLARDDLGENEPIVKPSARKPLDLLVQQLQLAPTFYTFCTLPFSRLYMTDPKYIIKQPYKLFTYDPIRESRKEATAIFTRFPSWMRIVAYLGCSEIFDARITIRINSIHNTAIDKIFVIY